MASIAAGVIHAAVVPEHLGEDLSFGIFFIASAIFQVTWAIAILVRSSAGIYAAGALANGAMIAIWLASRTTGLPVGPEPWVAEAIGGLDVAATALELVLVACSIAGLRHRAIGDHALMRSRLGSYRGSSDSVTG